MSKKLDLVGQKFGRLTVLEYSHNNKHGQTMWKCKCDCGNEIIIQGYSLKSGHSKSCGCYNVERVTERNVKHGDSKTRFYQTFISIKRRVYSKVGNDYKDYGGRGIKIEWKDYIEFKKDMYKSYLEHCKKYGIKETTIERIDVNGNYSKENCCWATLKEQANNKTTNNFITFKGETKTIAMWAEALNLKYMTLYNRINKYNWSLEKSLNNSLIIS